MHTPLTSYVNTTVNSALRLICHPLNSALRLIRTISLETLHSLAVLNSTVNSALRIIRTISLYTDRDKFQYKAKKMNLNKVTFSQFSTAIFMQ